MTEPRRSMRLQQRPVAAVFEGRDMQRAHAWLTGGHIIHVSTSVRVDGVSIPHSVALWFQPTLRFLVYMDVNDNRYRQNVPGQDWTAVRDNLDTAQQILREFVGTDVPVHTLADLNPTLHAEAVRFAADQVARGAAAADGGCGDYVRYVVLQLGEHPRA